MVGRLRGPSGGDASAACGGRSWGGTPLHNASYNGHLTTVRALLEAGANHSPGKNNGDTPLSFATSLGQHAVADALRAAGATS